MNRSKTVIAIVGALALGGCGSHANVGTPNGGASNGGASNGGASNGGASNGGASSGGMSGASAVKQFETDFAEAACAAMASCCQANEFPYESQNCVDTLKGRLQALEYTQGLNVTYDASAAAACIEDYSSTLRACTGSLDGVHADCGRIFVGTVPLRGACTDGTECAQPPFQEAFCQAGRCILFSDPLPVRGAPGDPCSATCTTDADGVDSCTQLEGTTAYACFTNDGLHCDSVSRACELLPTRGQPCDFDGCSGPNYCDSGVCAPKRETGPCTDSQACTPTTYCYTSTTTGVSECVLKLPDGQPCHLAEECAANYCPDGTCRTQVPVNADVCLGQLGFPY